MPVQIVYMTSKSHVASHFDHLDLRNAKSAIDAAIAIMLYWHGHQWHHVTPVLMATCDASTNGITWWKKSICTSFQSSWHKEAMVSLMIPLASCYTNASHQWCHMTKKVMLLMISIIFTEGMQWFHLQCHQHHMMPISMPVVSWDPNANGITWPKVSGSLFLLPWPKECNSAIDDTTGIMWHWCQHHQHHVTMTLTPMASCDTNANGIRWCQCQYPWCQCDQKSHFVPYFSCDNLRNIMVPLTML